MLTVRFPDGTSVQYNRASRLKYKDHVMELYEVRDGVESWVASVGYNCLVESSAACQVYNPVKNPSGALRFLLERLRALPTAELAMLKRELQDFNALTRRWK